MVRHPASCRPFGRRAFVPSILALVILGAPLAVRAALFPVSTEEIDKYLLIGTTSNDIAKAVNVQNGDLGADIVVLSTEIGDNVDFDLDDVFDEIGPWVDVNDTHSNTSDYLPGAGTVGEGVSWTGDVALTSTNAKFDMGNVELYGQVGVVAASAAPVSSVSNSEYFSDGLGDGFDTTGTGLAMPASGVTASANLLPLRQEIKAFEGYVTGLATEGVFSPTDGKIENQDYFEINLDAYDTNNDGIAVIDIDVGDKDFNITNSNIVLESEEGTFAIFRILNGSNMLMSQSTILMGDGIFGNSDATEPSDHLDELGALFVVANEYSDGEGGFNEGEDTDSGDSVFNFNNVVLNGVAFYDLVAFALSDLGELWDDGKTEIVINNGQGCTQFISPKINFNDVRFEHCAFPAITGDDDDDDEIPPVPTPAAMPMILVGLGLMLARRRHV